MLFGLGPMLGAELGAWCLGGVVWCVGSGLWVLVLVGICVVSDFGVLMFGLGFHCILVGLFVFDSSF